MRIAIYARVSTEDKGQDPENQLRELRQWCASAGHELVREYVDYESGRKGTKGRKQFGSLFEDAHKRRFDCVLFWALDRFTREGMVPTIMHLQRFASYGVGFHSYTEPHLATDNELVRNILLALLASLAKVEAQKISERTRAGMARAKARGKHIGRPAISLKLKQKIAERIAAGETAYGVAKDLGIDWHTVQKYGSVYGVTALAEFLAYGPRMSLKEQGLIDRPAAPMLLVNGDVPEPADAPERPICRAIQGVTTSRKILPSGQSAERRQCG